MDSSVGVRLFCIIVASSDYKILSFCSQKAHVLNTIML